MAWPKGRPRGENRGGRSKGTPNKVSKTVKDATLEAFMNLGGADGMTEWGRANKTEFYKIAARLIPAEIQGDPDRPLAVNVTFGGRYRQ